MQNKDGLLKPEAVAAYLNVSRASVWRWIRNGKLRAVRTPGGHIRIERAALEELTVQPTPATEAVA